MVTYVDNHVPVQKYVYMYLSKANSENNQTHGHMKNDNIMTCSQINSRRQYLIILFSTKLYTWSHTIFYEIIQNHVKTTNCVRLRYGVTARENYEHLENQIFKKSEFVKFFILQKSISNYPFGKMKIQFE